MAEGTEPRRSIPGVDALLRSQEFATLLTSRPRGLVLTALRRILERVRDELGSGVRATAPEEAELARATREALAEMERPSLRRVINATGIPLHTNLGRAPLPAAARAALEAVVGGYTNLEYDLETGTRGSRHEHCSDLLCELSGAEAAMVVNNNAAALVLVLNELAEGREVIVSRGELVEIGGSFRVPEIVAKSGARIVEVGATNRTHVRDYDLAIGPETGVLLKVHPSNFTQSGFVAEVSVEKLTQLAHDRELPVVHDIGSGLPFDLADRLGLPWEPNMRDSLAAGVDLVTCSGDKLLGGPQAGLIVGRADLMDRLRANPLLRAVRVGKLTLVALAATLRAWRDEEDVPTAIPALAMVATDPESLRRRAMDLADRLRRQVAMAKIETVEATTEVGGGSYPGGVLPAWVVRVAAPGRSESDLEVALRHAEPPVVARVRDGALVLDPRTVLPEEEPQLISAVVQALLEP